MSNVDKKHVSLKNDRKQVVKEGGSQLPPTNLNIPMPKVKPPKSNSAASGKK